VGGKRILATIGAVALIGGSFLQWIELGLASGLTRSGFDLELSVYFDWDEVGLADSFLLSAGMVTIALGVVALVGIATSRWGLARVAGILAVAAALLLWFSLANTSDMRLGYWIVAAGAALVTVGGFLPSRQAAAG
jgi:hypothetical protein